jgi:hypothetical protein
MPRLFKVLFPVFAVIALVVGVPLLLAPGRFLGIFGWAPVEPILDRILGSALLALAWASLRAWRSREATVIILVAEANAVFCALGAIGVLRHVISPAHYPLMVWTVLVVLAVFAVLWLIALVRR